MAERAVPAALVPRARRVSRALVGGATVLSAAIDRLAPGSRGATAQQGVVLAALALGMPHGAADTELLRAAAGGDRRRYAALLASYAAAALGATAVVRRGGAAVETAVLAASAAHFAEGELACWPGPPSGARAPRTALRLLTAATTTLALPAAVSRTAGRVTTALDGADAVVGRPHDGAPPGTGGRTPARAVGGRPGLSLLRDPGTRRQVALPLAAALGGTALLAASGDREPALDSALLTALAVLAPPSPAFAAYFGGWHAVRHTARVADALTAAGHLPPTGSLPGAGAALARRSAWAVAVGLLAAGALAAADPERASDAAFAAVLGLTVPHMTTVAVELGARSGRRNAGGLQGR